MERLKAFIQHYCMSTTGSIIGMIISMQMYHQTRLAVADIWGLLIANFIIILLSEVMYNNSTKSKLFYRIGVLMHYGASVFILLVIGSKLEWLMLDSQESILLFIALITLIYLTIAWSIVRWNYRVSKDINDALDGYRKRRER